METVITTIQGTYIVPANKEAALLQWLQANAIRQGQAIGEQRDYNGSQLVFE